MYLLSLKCFQHYSNPETYVIVFSVKVNFSWSPIALTFGRERERNNILLHPFNKPFKTYFCHVNLHISGFSMKKALCGHGLDVILRIFFKPRLICARCSGLYQRLEPDGRYLIFNLVCSTLQSGKF